ncbi:MAG: zinc ABC transporter substrate-binding protein [Firmicutes bacterium]|jgi:ABC-type Zn uptake system ZnuABC Zn-binding protein ZnuA|nr:zinc ABC transporter substrate-binding protein [Bacillota bacterium]HPU01193.1 metal ABC transporter substrate-binding protein [Bacillota bacterium]
MNRIAFKTGLLLLLLCTMTLPCAGCAGEPLPPAGEEAPLEIVATIFPLADIISRLGGEKVSATALLPAGASPHTFEPTTEQARSMARAQLLCYIGGGLDDWAAQAAAAGSGSLALLNLLEAAQERGWSPQPGEDEKPNPHLWLDPIAVRDYLCPAIAEAMGKADPQNAAYYRSKLAAYQEELTALDGEIRASLEGLPEKSFISVHAAWQYFASRYGLDQAAVIAEFPGQEPSASWIAGLVDLCRSHGVRVVAAEPQLSAAAAEMIAREIKGRVILLDPLGGAGLPGRDSYLNLMRYNAAVLKDAFTGQ